MQARVDQKPDNQLEWPNILTNQFVVIMCTISNGKDLW